MELRCTGDTGTLGNVALPVKETGTLNNALVGAGVHAVKWPDTSQLDALDISPERLLLH